MREVMDIKEAKEFLNVSDWKLRQWCKQKIVPHFRPAGSRRILFRRTSLENWIQEQEAATITMQQEPKNNRITHLVR